MTRSEDFRRKAAKKHIHRRENIIKNIKNGAPISEVTTETGSSAGAIITLDTVSQRTRKAPPKINDTGINILFLNETYILIICGIIIPTNPIGPVAETTAAIDKDTVK